MPIIASYIRALQSHGCTVVLNSSVPRVAADISGGRCEIVSIPELRRAINPVADIIATVKFAVLCRRRRFDVVHTHTSKVGVVGRLAARIAGVPIVIHTAHGFAFHEGSSRLTIATVALIERLAARWCDRIVFVSDFHRSWAVKLRIAEPEKLVTIHNGLAPSRVEARRSPTENRRSLDLPESARLIGTFGRLNPDKGLESLLDAMQTVVRQAPDVWLLIVGDGPLRADVQRRAERLGLKGKVILTGFREDVADLMSVCEIVVSASLREGLSVSIIEAMGEGKAIVATAIASTRELLSEGDCGVLVRPDDPGQLSTAILALLSEPERANALARRARARFEAEFTEERMQAQVWALYTGLIGG